MRVLSVFTVALALGCGGGSEEQAVEPVEVAAVESAGSEGEVTPEPATAPADVGPMSIEAPEDVGAPPASAEVTASGLASRVLRPGTGTAHPTEQSRVTVHYVGWTTDGERFDSSIERGEPATFPLNGVIEGWTEGVQLMVEGERRRFWIPADLAYGNSNRPGVPQGMLVFDVELLSIED